MGRLVKTHSTYIKGMLKWAGELARKKGIKTVTPGIIGRTRGRMERKQIRISRKTDNGYKLIVRDGKSYQEIYVISDLEIDEFKKILK